MPRCRAAAWRPAVALSLSLLVSSSALAATISDGTFANASWSSTEIVDTSGSASFLASQQLTDGNPAAFRQTVHVVPAGSQSIIVNHVYTAGRYDPSEQGEISSIDFSLDVRFISGTAGTSQVGHQLILVQDGTHYNALGSQAVAIGPGNGAPGTWINSRFSGLTAKSFTRIFGSGPPNPTFTRNGGPIQFGYLTLNTSITSQITVTSGIDNWSVTVNSLAVPPFVAGNYPAPGTTSTLAGGANRGSQDGTGSAAQFDNPGSVALDPAGNLIVADTFNHTIRKVSPAGVVTTLAGSAGSEGSTDGQGGAARFFFPAGVAVDSSGQVYVTDGRQTIRRISVDGVVTTLAGTSNAVGSADGVGAAARFNGPTGIAVEGNGNILVADTQNHTLRRISPAGVVTTITGGAGSAGFVEGPASTARFNLPTGVTVDSTGQIHVADNGNRVIRKISPAGIVSTLAGAPSSAGTIDGTGGAARFENVSGIAADGAGNIFVVDVDNHTLRRITPAGVVTTVAGTVNSRGLVNGVGSVARFFNPTGVAANAAGEIFIADRLNNAIRKVVIAEVSPQPVIASRISNISVRTTLGAAQTLIMGFTMQGGAKPVLLRAVGPGLAPFGVTGTMADPRLAVFKDSAQLETNDNWGGGNTLSNAFTSLGAFGLPSSSLDAALLRSIEGGHTAQVTGTGAGTVLVEAYDAGTGLTPRLTNVSARNRSGTGADILIAGFTLGGTGSKNLLIRAVGPTLAVFGVPGTLADPKLEVYSGSTKIAESDNWVASLATTFASVGAFPLTAGSRDAALTISLPPGGYTVQVSGADGGTGEALVELYELP